MQKATNSFDSIKNWNKQHEAYAQHLLKAQRTKLSVHSGKGTHSSNHILNFSDNVTNTLHDFPSTNTE
jgi:hypothetical protein